jgi:alpha-D-ribose 1-methylphosphonate 5-triphosphate synthase subunit PhnG
MFTPVLLHLGEGYAIICLVVEDDRQVMSPAPMSPNSTPQNPESPDRAAREPDPHAGRKAWMSLLAQAAPARLQTALADLGDAPDHDWLRRPERGAVMVRGRAGGTGAAFNLGEMSVTRCALALACGTVGHAYVPGRDAGHATRAALCDALLQTGRAAQVEAQILAPLRAAAAADAAAKAAKADGTRVDFFTMVRGED